MIASQTVVRDGSQQGQSEGHVMFYYTDYQKVAGTLHERYSLRAYTGRRIRSSIFQRRFPGWEWACVSRAPVATVLESLRSFCAGLVQLGALSWGLSVCVQCVLEAAAHSSTISVQGLLGSLGVRVLSVGHCAAASPNKAKCVGVPTGPDIYRC